MSPPLVELGSWVAVFVVENAGKYHVSVDHWDEIDAAMHHWAERRIDRVLTLTSNDGEALLIPASRISDVSRSTPVSRERQRALEAASKAEMGFEEP